MFLPLLAALLIAAAFHFALGGERTLRRGGELGLVWLLVGYCGVPMIGVAAGALAWPDRAADILGFPAGNPFQSFAMVAYLGMSLVAVLSLRYRGAYLVAPALLWAVFFAGATWIHLADLGHRGALTHGMLAIIVGSHGAVSVLLLASLAASGVWRKEERVGP